MIILDEAAGEQNKEETKVKMNRFGRKEDKRRRGERKRKERKGKCREEGKENGKGRENGGEAGGGGRELTLPSEGS